MIANFGLPFLEEGVLPNFVSLLTKNQVKLKYFVALPGHSWARPRRDEACILHLCDSLFLRMLKQLLCPQKTCYAGIWHTGIDFNSLFRIPPVFIMLFCYNQNYFLKELNDQGIKKTAPPIPA